MCSGMLDLSDGDVLSEEYEGVVKNCCRQEEDAKGCPTMGKQVGWTQMDTLHF